MDGIVLTNHKELRHVLRAAEQKGWAFVRGKSHIKGTHSSGKTVTVSVSPSDGRAINNIRKDLRL